MFFNRHQSTAGSYRVLRSTWLSLTESSCESGKKTANTLLGILKLALEMAWENGEFENERIWRTIRRLPHKDTPRQLALSRPECTRLLAACRVDLGKLVLAALYTGCRVSELCRLQVRDVSVSERFLYVEAGKSRRGRYVHLPSDAVAFFAAECSEKSQTDLIFTMASGHRWNGNHKHLFRAAVSAAGLPSDFVFHGLRHTYASQLVQAGMPLIFVARQLGHASTDTVSRTYGHLSAAHIEQEIEFRFLPILNVGPGKVESEGGTLSEANSEERVRAVSWPTSNRSRASWSLCRRNSQSVKMEKLIHRTTSWRYAAKAA